MSILHPTILAFFNSFRNHFYIGALFLTLFTNNLLFSQNTVNGKVVDAENGEPLIGATILQKRTQHGTVTDIDGSFYLKLLVDSPSIVSISYTGYTTKDIEINSVSRKVIVINLEPGVGTTCGPYILHFAFSEGAIKRIKPEIGEHVGMPYAAQLLQNEIAGLTVSRPGDDPNEDYFFQMRGISSFLMRPTPLIVVDGMPGVSLYLIDPNDISEIKVLKDAAAAAKYGILGNSGVVEVTTLQAKNYGGMSLQYQSYLSGQAMGRKIPIAGKERFLSAGGIDLGHDTDWIDQITENAFSHGHHLSYSNRHRRIDYMASAGYKSNKGVLNNSGFEQLNGRLFLNARPNNKLNINSQLAFTKRDANYSIIDAFQKALQMNPTVPVRSYDPFYESFGYYFHQQGRGDNPVSLIVNTGNLERYIEKTGYLNFDYKLYGSQKLFSSLNYRDKDNTRVFNKTYESVSNPRRDKGVVHLSQLNTTFGHEINYRFGSANIKQSTGLGFHLSHEKTVYQTGRDIISNDKLDFSNLNDPLTKYAANVNTGLDLKAGHRIYSLFSNTQVEWNGWELNSHIMYNGLTYFFDEEYNDDINYALFYGATLGINLSQLLSLQNFSEAKLRIGYGKTGGIYEAQNKLNGEFRSATNQNLNTDWTPINMKEYDVIKSKWEEKREINAGFDFVVFNGKVSSSIDVYHNNVSELMVNHSWWLTPFGDVTNSGMEAEINISLIDNRIFSWKANLLFCTNKSILNRFSTTSNFQEKYDYLWLENGKEAGLMYAYRVDDELKYGNYAPVDVNGDGDITFEEDAKIIGSAFPKINLGWQNHLSTGRFNFHFKLRSVLGHKIANGYRILQERNNSKQTNIVITKYFRDDLTQELDFAASTYFEKGDFLKLDYLNISYEIPFDKIKCNVYLSGQNLLTLTGYTGLDPEPRYIRTADPLHVGVETEMDYYRGKTITLGLRLNL